MKQTYENYHKAYYHLNKDKIKKRRKSKGRRDTNKKYYEKNKEIINKKRVAARRAKREELRKLMSSQNDQKDENIPVSDIILEIDKNNNI